MQSLFNQITAGTVNVTGSLTLNGNSVLTGLSTGNSFYDSFSANIKTVTGNYNFTNSDYSVLFSGNSLTGTLPSAATYSGLIYQVKLITGSVVLTGSQNIDNGTTYSSFTTDKGIALQSDGNQWWVINHSPTGLLTGSFYPLNSNPSGYITTGQTGVFSASGNFYPLNSNPSGYITTGQTGSFGGGSFNTGTLVGTFYLNSNPSGYITTGQTGNFGGGSFNTGTLVGTFYLNSNPSGYITGVNTGSFITTGQTGSFYPMGFNPSGYITGVNLSSYVTTGSTGSFITTGQTGAFYPLGFNPSGYITTGQTGNFGGGSFNTGTLVGVFAQLNTNQAGNLNISGSGNFTSGIILGGPLNLKPSLISGALTLGSIPFYIFTGTGLTTWTMPPINTCTGITYFVKNRGNTVTLTGAGSDQIFADTNYNSFNILSGQAFILINDSKFWSVL